MVSFWRENLDSPMPSPSHSISFMNFSKTEFYKHFFLSQHTRESQFHIITLYLYIHIKFTKHETYWYFLVYSIFLMLFLNYFHDSLNSLQPTVWKPASSIISFCLEFCLSCIIWFHNLGRLKLLLSQPLMAPCNLHVHIAMRTLCPWERFIFTHSWEFASPVPGNLS